MQFIRYDKLARLSPSPSPSSPRTTTSCSTEAARCSTASAPIIKLPADATEDDHLALLGLLNSSTACFWMKQVLHRQGQRWDRTVASADEALGTFVRVRRHTDLQTFPVPEAKPLDLARQLDRAWPGIQSPRCPMRSCKQTIPTQSRLEEARTTGDSTPRPDDRPSRGTRLAVLPALRPAERRPAIRRRRPARTRAGPASLRDRHGPPDGQGRTCKRPGSSGTARRPSPRLPSHWPDAYRKLVERRIEIIETNKEIGLIEKPEYKRRWNDEPWEEQQQRALRNWLLDRLESPRYWPDASRHEPTLQSTAQLADKASGDHEFLQVAALYRGRPDFDVAALVTELVEGESVPFLPVLRYKPSGLRKREVWERTWDLQRKQDAGEDVGDIPVPPKYTSADFLKQDYWRLRGKLDVPKERWISYPHLQTESDPSLVVGWAGWNHLQQATALVAYYDARKREGWDAKRLTPILAGLDQLLPWIHQWHPEIDPEFGDTAGQSYQSLLENDAHELGLTLEDIRNWQPPAKGGKRKAKG